MMIMRDAVVHMGSSGISVLSIFVDVDFVAGIRGSSSETETGGTTPYESRRLHRQCDRAAAAP